MLADLAVNILLVNYNLSELNKMWLSVKAGPRGQAPQMGVTWRFQLISQLLFLQILKISETGYCQQVIDSE